jgi:hypothetical protein
MTDREQDLLSILRIGHETSIRGAGVSLQDALARTRYRELRATFGPADLLPLIRSNATLCNEWLAYSQDKRTTGGWKRTAGGWYLLEDGRVGRLEPKVAPQRFESKEEAVASFVVRELDFWARINHAG